MVLDEGRSIADTTLRVGRAPEAIAQQIGWHRLHEPTTAKRCDANPSLRGPGGDELSEMVNAETNGLTDANGFELAAHDEVMDRCAAKAELLACLLDGHQPCSTTSTAVLAGTADLTQLPRVTPGVAPDANLRPTFCCGTKRGT